MNKSVEVLDSEIAELQLKLKRLLEQQDAINSAKTGTGAVSFSKETLKDHKSQRVPVIYYILHLPLRYLWSAPFVYGMLIPIALLDISLAIYQTVCFRLWRLPRIRRSDYVIIDRHHLAYLNGFEKLNCIYCGYANGVFAFARELAALTEYFWCPIKHASKIHQPHDQYHRFVAFGDLETWKDHPSRKKPKRSKSPN